MFIYPEADCQVNINNSFVRQDIKPGVLNIIDLTGYLSKGENLMYIDFPFTPGLKKFAARVTVEYYNYDRNDFCTDQSWIFKDMYTNPVSFRKEDDVAASRITEPPSDFKITTPPGFSEWNISVPYGTLDNINNVYLGIKYNGDRAELYNGNRMAADNFNDNRTWSLGLSRLETSVEGKTLRLVIYDLSRSAKIFFDIPPSEDAYEKTSIVSFGTRAEYKANLKQADM